MVNPFGNERVRCVGRLGRVASTAAAEDVKTARQNTTVEREGMARSWRPRQPGRMLWKRAITSVPRKHSPRVGFILLIADPCPAGVAVLRDHRRAAKTACTARDGAWWPEVQSSEQRLQGSEREQSTSTSTTQILHVDSQGIIVCVLRKSCSNSRNTIATGPRMSESLASHKHDTHRARQLRS